MIPSFILNVGDIILSLPSFFCLELMKVTWMKVLWSGETFQAQKIDLKDEIFSFFLLCPHKRITLLVFIKKYSLLINYRLMSLFLVSKLQLLCIIYIFLCETASKKYHPNMLIQREKNYLIERIAPSRNLWALFR